MRLSHYNSESFNCFPGSVPWAIVPGMGERIVHATPEILPIWHNLTSTLAPRSEAKLRSDIVPSIRCPIGVGSETEWTDIWSAQSDDDCPFCGARHMSPYKSDDLTESDDE